MTVKLFPILLVEDDVNDVFFFQRALKKVGVAHPLAIAVGRTGAADGGVLAAVEPNAVGPPLSARG